MLPYLWLIINTNINSLPLAYVKPFCIFDIKSRLCYQRKENYLNLKESKQVKPSARGELEITTLNQMYLEESRLKIENLPRGFAWLDTGTFDSLSQASNYVETIEKRTGLQIACLEEIGYINEWLTDDELKKSIELLKKNDYGKYLENLLNKTNGVE